MEVHSTYFYVKTEKHLFKVYDSNQLKYNLLSSTPIYIKQGQATYSDMGEGVSKMAKKIPTSFMDGRPSKDVASNEQDLLN